MILRDIPAGTRVGVAVSGGADSVYLLRRLQPLGLAVVVLHVNHQLRGAESDGDEAFVRELAADLCVPLAVVASPVEAGNVEQEARRARYAFFARVIAGGACDVVATGHSLDDQAETILARFLRGAGTAGLSGIRPATETGIVRPLLDTRREEIRSWLSERGFAWREDQSNRDTRFLRNRIRLEIMPLLTGLNPALPQVLASTASWALGEEEYWDAELSRMESQYLKQSGEAIFVGTAALRELAPAVARRLLRRAVEKVRGSLRSIDFQHIEAIRALAAVREGSGRLQIPDLDIYRSFDLLRLAPIGFDSRLERDFEVLLHPPASVSLPERRLTIDLKLVNNSDVYNNQMNVLDWSRCAGTLTLRNWRPGDSYCPAGKSSPEKIKTLFQQFRVPLWERRGWPVLTHQGSILWSRRFGAAADMVARTDSCRVLVIQDGGESNGSLAASN